MRGTGDPQTVIVLRTGSDTEMTSGLSGDDVKIIGEAPGIEHGADGAHMSPELFVIVESSDEAGRRRRQRAAARALARRARRPDRTLKITEGRMFQPGTNEIVVGRAASRQFMGLTVGSSVKWGQGSWHVVGIFDAGGSVAESEIWCDARVLQPVYRRGNSYQSVYARLESTDSLQKFKDALTTDRRLNVTVFREPDYYAAQSQVLQTVIRTVGLHHRGSDGAGGGLRRRQHHVHRGRRTHTRDRHAARARVRQLPCRRLGARRRPVLLSLVGGLIGGVLAWAAFDGYQTATMNWQSFSQVAFAFAVTPALLLRGLLYAVVHGARRRAHAFDPRRTAPRRDRTAADLTRLHGPQPYRPIRPFGPER